MEIIDNKCLSCGANLNYNAKTKNWKCNFCNSIYNIENLKNTTTTQINSISELVCPNCSAKLLIKENIISLKCIYCDNSVIINKTNDKYKTPDKIILFSITKEMAKEKLISKLNNKKLLPNDFNLIENITDIKGVYIPYWLYSNKYKVNIKYHDKRSASTTNIYGGLVNAKTKLANVTFKLIPFDANKHLDNKITKALEPFNYNDLIDFNPSYLSGFIAQKYDISHEVGENDIKSRCINSISDIFTSKHSKYYTISVKMIKEELIEQHKYYALLPIWLLNIKYNNKTYFIAINGQTGKVAGTIPIDKKKYKQFKVIIFLTFIIIFTVIVVTLRWIGVV